MSKTRRAKRLKPTGHSALIESLIQPAIVVGSTLMSAIAAYVLALDELTRILDRRGAPSDYFIVALCGGMGFLIDMAIIVSATRYKMHTVRANPNERHWLTLAKWVLAIGLISETMTLLYFFVHLSPQAFPDWILQIAMWIHSALAISRSFLPPIVIAYFAAGVLPIMFDRADRNREIKSRTSSNIMVLIDRLSEVEDTDNKAEMLRALGGQLMLDTYAQYDETTRTTEDEQLQRDAKLLTHLARIHRLDWSEIAADVAPALRTMTPSDPVSESPKWPETDASTQAGGAGSAEMGHNVPPASLPPVQYTPWELVLKSTSPAPEEPPKKPPTGPGSPSRRRGVRTPPDVPAPNIVQMPAAPTRRRRRKKATRARGRTNVSVEAKARAKWEPGLSVGALQEAAGISKGSAQKYHAKFTAEDAARAQDVQRLTQQAVQ